MARTRSGRGRGRGGGGGEKSSASPTETRTKEPKKQKRNAGKSTKSDLDLNRLANKPEKFTRADVTCPICWSVLFEPVTLPCNHSLCQICLQKHTSENSLNCPCCRTRLGVWCRRAEKEKKLIDEQLWLRIQNEFPGFVEARKKGEDSQNLFDELSPVKSASQSQVTSRPPIDGIASYEPGSLKSDLQQMMEQHQRDLEIERQREESESANLIKQLQMEEELLQSKTQSAEKRDLAFAQELESQLKTDERSSGSTIRNAPLSSKNPRRNLVEEWVKQSPGSQSISTAKKPGFVTNTPKRSTKKVTPKLRTLSQRRISNATGNRSKPTATVTSMDVSRASQNLMTNFLSSSQQNHSQSTSPHSIYQSPFPIFEDEPCCSRTIPKHDINNSAFSPTKPFSSPSILIPSDILAVPVCTSQMNNLKIIDENTLSTKTPDSIQSEVERHFRPIACHPRTPSKCAPDGTKPSLIKTTPIRPVASAAVISYIVSPVRQFSDNTKPSCATSEKRISNDSGRASDDSRSPDMDTSPLNSRKVSVKKQMDRNEREYSSDDYRVTPEEAEVDSKKAVETLKRQYSDEGSGTSTSNKKGKYSAGCSSDRKVGQISFPEPQVKQEPLSPTAVVRYIAGQRQHRFNKPTSGDNAWTSSSSSNHDVKVEQDDSLNFTCSQGEIKIENDDVEYIELERQTLDSYKSKLEQEAADRAFAEALQRSLNRGIDFSRGRSCRERYSLRNWLKPKVKNEVKTEEDN